MGIATPPPTPPGFQPVAILRRTASALWPPWPLWLAALLGVLLGGLHGIDPGLSPTRLLLDEFTPSLSAAIDTDRLLDVFSVVNDAVLTLPENRLVLYGAFTLLLIVGLLSYAFGSWMEAALITGVARRLTDQPVRLVPLLGQSFRRAGVVFWVRILIGVSLVVPLTFGIFAVFAAMLTTFILVAGVETVAAAISLQQVLSLTLVIVGCGGPLMLLFVIVSALLAWIEVLAVRAAVLENLGWWSAIRRGAALLRHHWVLVVPLWLVIAALRNAVTFILGAPLQFLSGALIFAHLDLLTLAATPPLTLALIGVVAPILALVAATLGAALHLLISAYWTTTYHTTLAPA